MQSSSRALTKMVGGDLRARVMMTRPSTGAERATRAAPPGRGFVGGPRVRSFGLLGLGSTSARPRARARPRRRRRAMAATPLSLATSASTAGRLAW